MSQATVKSAEHEEWLVEAGKALAEAERLTGLLALVRPRQDLTLAALQAQIMVLRREVDRLQRNRVGERRREFYPEWTEKSAWYQLPNRS